MEGSRRLRDLEWLAVGAFVEFLVFGSLVLGIISVVLGAAQLLDEHGDRLRGFARAVLVSGFAFAIVMFGHRLLGGFLPGAAVPLSLLAVMLVELVTIRWTERDHRRLSGGELVVLIGPLVMWLVVLFAFVRARRTFPWAMSGDARNHILIVRDTIDAGGIPIPGYPALGNALAALAGGWQFDISAVSEGRLGSEIAAVAVTMVLLLSAVSILAVSLVGPASKARDPQIVVGLVVLSLLPLTQFWLHTYLFEGFLPTALAVAAMLAVAVEMSRADSTPAWRIASCVMGIAVLGFTYPPLMPIAAGLLPLAVVAGWVQTWPTVKYKSVVFGVIVAASALGALALRHPRIEAKARQDLNLYGRISPVDSWGLVLLTVLLVILFVVSNRHSRMLATAAVSIGMSSVVIDRFLDGVIDAEYYVDKTRWMSTFVLLALAVATVTSMIVESAPTFRRVVAAVTVLGVVAASMFPFLQEFPRRSVLRTVAMSWSLPSAEEARLILETNDRNPRSVFWRVSPDPLTTRVINIWITSGMDETDANVTWGYKADVFSVDGVCAFAASNAPATVWVPSEGAAKVFDEGCDLEGVSIEVID